MTVRKFTITAEVSGLGKVQHVIREVTEDAALQRIARAYPDQELSIVRLLRDTVPAAAAHSNHRRS